MLPVIKTLYDGKEGDIINQYVNSTRVFDEQVRTYGLSESFFNDISTYNNDVNYYFEV